MSKRDPYKNVKLYEKLAELDMNDYQLVKIIAQEAKRINEKTIREGKETKEKPTTKAIKNLLDNRINYIFDEEDGQP